MSPRIVVFTWFVLTGIGATLIALILLTASILLLATILHGRATIAAGLRERPVRLEGSPSLVDSGSAS